MICKELQVVAAVTSSGPFRLPSSPTEVEAFCSRFVSALLWDFTPLPVPAPLLTREAELR